MSLIPKTTCIRCHRQYPSTRGSCPYCGEKKPREVRRTVPEADSAVRGTAASARSAENLNWQMLFGSIIVLAVIAAVIVLVSTGITKDMAAVQSNQPEEPVIPDVQVAATAAPTSTPEPSPTPSDVVVITSINITFMGQDEPGFTQYVGDVIDLDAMVYPLNSGLTVEWSSSDETIATVDQDGKVTLLASGNCSIYAKVAEQQDECIVVSRSR